MASESEQCVDALIVKQTKIEHLLNEFDLAQDAPHNSLITEARQLVSDTQCFIDNNKSVIPSYCLKKAADSLRKLEEQINKPSKSRLQFKFKPSNSPAKTSDAKSSESPPKAAKKPFNDSSGLFGFCNREKEDLFLDAGTVEAKDLSFINITDCNVIIRGLANTVYIRDIKNSTVTVCLACRAIAIANSKNCEFKLICQQLRIDATLNCRFKLFVTARSMMESSHGLEFSPIKQDDYAESKMLMQEAKFDENKNNWRCIDDFDWLSPDTPSKNYKIVES